MAECEKVRILGKGSYAVVYLVVISAPQKWNSKVAAMKSSTSNAFGSFVLQKEKKIMELFIGCKEIVQCYFGQFTVQKGHLTYDLFMEFSPYGSLGDLIRKKPLMENEVRIYTCMLLKGLSCIHERGVVHCDLKPDNILLFPSSEDGARYQLKIADFGLSKTRQETIDADFWKIKFRGTPFYMSPESVMGRIETSLDIWSLGCIVIEMITGLRAWKNLQSKEDIMFKLAFLKEAPMIPNGLSEDCKDFLSKCFVKDPDHRWTASMLLNHPFLYPSYNIYTGYRRFSMYSSTFFSYDICDYASLEV
ncbi:mitogen-activated protein kinase kinase kinase 17-like [Abrus precatorius]|uniref:Mitogen-activated protein kinase kinase kinase 17-like n=1 Tax=Abrus precatorius TaxID=3816 RepID=A0A8B8M2F9_ABRPR|nr:mitogen-activated protein kinase kinase kinase 17-like [Abrus precatorius]XP_027362862.1 mitogen-activated protein kinase kinase kinase 17-like [Abrus precatorius]